MTLQHLRSSTANKRPDPTAMADGQIALNTAAASPGLFYKDSAGNLVKAGPVHVGSTAPNVSPASGGTAGNSTGEAWLDTSGSNPLLKIWGGAAWQTVQPVASGTVVSTADTGSVTSTMIANGTIVDADVNASAAIAGTKISPNFGSQNVTTTGTSTAASFIPTSSTVPTNGVYLPAANSVALSTNGTGRLFVDSSGRVGVGASTIGGFTGNSVLFIKGSNQAANTGQGQLTVLTTDAQASGVGASVVLGGQSTAADFPYAIIAGRSEGNSYAGYFSVSTATSAGAINERLRITSAGLVGVGTSSPSALLHIVSGDAIQIIENSVATSNASLQLKYPSRTWTIANRGADLSGSLAFRDVTAGADRVVIDSSGRVGIGSSSPSNALTVQSTSRPQLHVSYNGNGGIYLTSANDVARTNWQIASSETTANTLQIYPSDSVGGTTFTTPAVTIDASRRVGIGSSTPSRRLQVGDYNGGNAIEIATNSTSNGGIFFADGNTGTSTYPGYIEYNHSVDAFVFATANNERFRCDSSGRLLVGTTTGTSRLSIAGTADNANSEIQITATNVASGYIGANSNGLNIGTDTAGLIFKTGVTGGGSVGASGTERMRIKSNGNTNFFINAYENVAVRTAGTDPASIAFQVANGASSTTTGTTRMVVRDDGDLENTNNSYGSLSDIKLKENIVDAGSQWFDIKSLQIRKYNFKEETGHSTHTQIGLIAQEVELVSPGLVSESPDLDAEGNDLGTTTKAVQYSVLYMKAVKALQEAMERIETLEAKVAAIESA